MNTLHTSASPSSDSSPSPALGGHTQPRSRHTSWVRSSSSSRCTRGLWWCRCTLHSTGRRCLFHPIVQQPDLRALSTFNESILYCSLSNLSNLRSISRLYRRVQKCIIINIIITIIIIIGFVLCVVESVAPPSESMRRSMMNNYEQLCYSQPMPPATIDVICSILCQLTYYSTLPAVLQVPYTAQVEYFVVVVAVVILIASYSTQVISEHTDIKRASAVSLMPSIVQQQRQQSMYIHTVNILQLITIWLAKQRGLFLTNNV